MSAALVRFLSAFRTKVDVVLTMSLAGRQTITQDPRFWTDLSLKSDATALHKSATHLDRLGSKRLLSLSICLNKPSTVWRLEQHMRPALSDLIKLTFAVEDDRDMIRACSKVLAHAALSLQELYIISRNVVAFDLPLFPFLAALPRLTVLDVRASGIVEGPPKGRWSIPDKSHVRQRPVKHLHLERAYFGPGIFLDDAGASESDSSRQVMDNVEHLGLAIEFTPGQPFRLSDWPNLTSLQVESTQANPDWLSPSPNDPVPQVVNLQSLHITDIGNDSAWPLQEWLFPALKELRIHNGRSTSLRLSLDHLCRTSPSLEDLSLTSSIKVDDTLLHHLATKWTGLRRLNVAQSFLDGNFVTSIVNEGLLPRLESINLSACVPLRASPLIKLVQRGLQQRPENSTGSDDMPSSTFAIIQEMILLDCENLEKEGVDWLKTQVPVFRHRWADPKLLRKGQNGTRNSRAVSPLFMLTTRERRPNYELR